MRAASADVTETDVVVVGAGPIGIECAAALKRAGIEYVQVEAGAIGATMMWWSPGTQFFSSPERIGIAGVPLVTRDQQKATREEYLDYLRQVVRACGLDVRLYERVVGVRRLDAAASGGNGSMRAGGDHDEGGPASGARYELTTRLRSGPERRIRCVRVVLAIGDMHRAKLLGAEGEDLPHVSHYLGEVHGYYDRDVLIVGGRNSAVEAAIRLYRVGARVTISYRRATFSKKVKYWLRPELLWLIDSGRLGFVPDSEVKRIGPGWVELRRSAAPEEAAADDGWRASVAADHVLLMTGYEQDSSLFEMFGVTLEGEARSPRHDPDTMHTDVGGVYVAGTAAAGTQASGVTQFIETSHVHVERIVASLRGERMERADVRYQLEES
jgi:thioredoxin reductase (NADPH)